MASIGKARKEQLETALMAVRSDETLAKAFAADPKGYLAKQGIDVTGLEFAPAPSSELTDGQLESVAGGAGGCWSVGYIACYSEGGVRY